MSDSFDFDKAGYDAPGDWARIRDLMPGDIKPGTLAKWQASGSRKTDAVRILKDFGIDVPMYDAEAARTRRANS